MEIRNSEREWMANSCKFLFLVAIICILILIFAIFTSPAVIRAHTKSSHCALDGAKFPGNGFKSLSINIIGARLSVNYRHVFIIRTIIESSNAHRRLRGSLLTQFLRCARSFSCHEIDMMSVWWGVNALVSSLCIAMTPRIHFNNIANRSITARFAVVSSRAVKFLTLIATFISIFIIVWIVFLSPHLHLVLRRLRKIQIIGCFFFRNAGRRSVAYGN